MNKSQKSLLAMALGAVLIILLGIAIWVNPRLLELEYLRRSLYSILINPYTVLYSGIILSISLFIRNQDWAFFSNRSFTLLAISVTAAIISIFLFTIALPVDTRNAGLAALAVGLFILVALAAAIILAGIGIASLYLFVKGFSSAKRKKHWDIYYPLIVFSLLAVGTFLPSIYGFLADEFPCGTVCEETMADKKEFIQFVAENGRYIQDPHVGRVFYKEYGPHSDASFDTVLNVAKETSNPEACDFLEMHESLCRFQVSGQDEDRAIQEILRQAKNGNTSSCSRLMSYNELMPEVQHDEIKIGNPRTRQVIERSASIVVPFKSHKGRYFNEYQLEDYYQKDLSGKELVSSGYYQKFLETYFELNYCVDNENPNCEKNEDGIYMPQENVETNPTYTLSINKRHHPPKDLMKKYLKPKLISEEYCRNLANNG